jgi:MTH538 TIR-like domain (DUF1863)
MRRVFISFKMEDKKQVDGVRLMSWNKGHELEFFDESVRISYKSLNASYIKSKIKQKIERSSITLCLLSAQTHFSEWVDWELSTSIMAGNKIVLMSLPNGPNKLALPLSVRDRSWWRWNLDVLTQELI